MELHTFGFFWLLLMGGVPIAGAIMEILSSRGVRRAASPA